MACSAKERLERYLTNALQWREPLERIIANTGLTETFIWECTIPVYGNECFRWYKINEGLTENTVIVDYIGLVSRSKDVVHG